MPLFYDKTLLNEITVFYMYVLNMCFEFMVKVPLLEGTEISHGYKANKFVCHL